MASAAWRGAVKVNGVNVNLALWPTVKSTRGESFRTLAPNGAPISQFKRDSEGNEVTDDECSKGVELAKGEFRALSAEAVERITAAEKSVVLELEYLAPVDTIPVYLATKSFYVRADDKVAGAEGNADVLWNGLRASGLALVTQATIRGGSPDHILVLWANEYALMGATFPFSPQLYVEPVSGFTVNEEAGEVFSKVMLAKATVQDFNCTNHVSTYSKRRAEVIEAELAGETIEIPEAAPVEQGEDLMAQLKAAMA